MKQAEEPVSLEWRNPDVILGTNHDYGIGYNRPSVGAWRETMLQCKSSERRRPGNVGINAVARDAQGRAGSGSERQSSGIRIENVVCQIPDVVQSEFIGDVRSQRAVQMQLDSLLVRLKCDPNDYRPSEHVVEQVFATY